MAGRQGVGWRACLLAGVCALVIAVLSIAVGSPWKSVAGEPAELKPCSKQEAKQGLKQFIRAYNWGRSEKLDRMFTQDPEFLAYTIGPPGVRTGARQRDTLIPYFRARHRRHDKLHLRHFRSHQGHGLPFFERSTHFVLYMARRADDFIEGRWFRTTAGKGAMVCENGDPRIFLLNIGGHPWMTRR